jgi:hypothetical protein
MSRRLFTRRGASCDLRSLTECRVAAGNRFLKTASRTLGLPIYPHRLRRLPTTGPLTIEGFAGVWSFSTGCSRIFPEVYYPVN